MDITPKDNIMEDKTSENSSSYFEPDLAQCIASEKTIQSLCDAHPLPEPTQTKLRRWLSAYRRLFVLALVVNLAVIGAMIWMAVQRPGSFTYADATTAVAANLFVATVMRHEHAINILFRLAIFLTRKMPLSIRRHAAKVYCHGGLHSGCGLAALLWYIFFTVLAIKDFRFADNEVYYTFIGTIVVMVALFVAQISIPIYPAFRSKRHDLWELCHRFGAWSAIAIIWVQIVLVTVYTAKHQHKNAGILLIETPAFWLLLFITFCLVYPWLRLRRVKVQAERLSSHAVRLWFDHRSVETCVGIRLSHYPLLDNHGFATIPNEDGEKGFSVLVSKAGDFTTDLINNPPTHIWKRGAHTIGVARVALLFRPLVLVATGSGIGPCLSFLQARPDWPVRVVWSTRDPLATYGETVMRSVLRADPDAIIINTSSTGRPPLLRITYGLVRGIGAEAVVIISNPKVTEEIVTGLERREVAAFGAIFDS